MIIDFRDKLREFYEKDKKKNITKEERRNYNQLELWNKNYEKLLRQL